MNKDTTSLPRRRPSRRTMSALAAGVHDSRSGGPGRAVEDPDGRYRRHLGWQRHATRLLAELLQAGARDGLPPITWTIGTTGALVGHCHPTTNAVRRREFELWCFALAATAQSEFSGAHGVVHLRAIAPNVGRLIEVCLVAQLFDDEEVEQ